MSDVSMPRTPTPEPILSRGPNSNVSLIPTAAGIDTMKRGRFESPPIPLAVDLTPPPSSQVPSSGPSEFVTKRARSLASPPDTLRPGAPLPLALGGGINEIPSIGDVENLTETQLRSLVVQLLPALSDARMSAAHSKLQYSLLSIENSESIKRAQVEHELTRREVEVLLAGSSIYRDGSARNTPRSPQLSAHSRLDLALEHCRQLETENVVLEHRVKRAKKLILQAEDKNLQLAEDNHQLRQRIKQNRDHLNAMRSSGALSVNGTPLTGLGISSNRTALKPFGNSRSIQLTSNPASGQDPFDALLAAGQALNVEANSVPSTPNHHRKTKLHQGHVRGAHSLSSLPTTPNRSRPTTADNLLLTPINHSTSDLRVSYSAPNTQLTYNQDNRRREDRDSTISASDNEEAFTDDDVPASSASQAATSMLRRSSTAKANATAPPGATPDTKMVQAKLFGIIKKPSAEKFDITRKKREDVEGLDEEVRSSKKARLGDANIHRVGLGISSWPSPGL
ncbi:hypothetical protein MMC12_003774 [Toensbergia leucococca]|nr:hypothetical protein [Toensbergia leucococca]